LIEFGPNIGLNLLALKKIFKLKFITAVEINKKACLKIRKIKKVNILNKAIIDFSPVKTFDMVLLKGVLIHSNPDQLKKIYEIIYKSCKVSGYILIAEYYNPTPVAIAYRGHQDKLFKRDFAKEIWTKYPKLKLIN
jgi:spore coat polysaccharide biosynthesis protein SpsF